MSRKIPNIIGTKSNVGTQIRCFRLANKLTQTQLAKRIGISRGFLSRIETGRVSLKDQPLFVNLLFTRLGESHVR